MKKNVFFLLAICLLFAGGLDAMILPDQFYFINRSNNVFSIEFQDENGEYLGKVSQVKYYSTSYILYDSQDDIFGNAYMADRWGLRGEYFYTRFSSCYNIFDGRGVLSVGKVEESNGYYEIFSSDGDLIATTAYNFWNSSFKINDTEGNLIAEITYPWFSFERKVEICNREIFEEIQPHILLALIGLYNHNPVKLWGGMYFQTANKPCQSQLPSEEDFRFIETFTEEIVADESLDDDEKIQSLYDLLETDALASEQQEALRIMLSRRCVEYETIVD